MALPQTPNNTCDIYRTGNAPPATPDVAAVPCYFKALFQVGLETGEGDATSKKFDHVLVVDCSTDIRDAYDAGAIGATADTVYIPDKNGVGYTVIYVEIMHWGMAGQHKGVYVSRKTTTFPTNNL
jgi:hypothetical protein